MQPAARPSFQILARPWRWLSAALVARGRRWVLKRQGHDPSSVVLDRRRIYILPTGLGLAFAVMLFAMLLGGVLLVAWLVRGT